MAFLACLQFGSSSPYLAPYKLCNIIYHAHRANNGLRPDADMLFDIELTVIVPPKDDQKLHQWFVNGEEQSGRILIELSTDILLKNKYTCKQMLFKEAYCYALSEHFKNDDSSRREMSLSITAKSEGFSEIVEVIDFANSSNAAKNLLSMMVMLDLTKNHQPVTSETIGAYAIEELTYDCRRELNREGIPYGITPATTLEFVTKVATATSGEAFYEAMDTNDPQNFTFLFDADFSKSHPYMEDKAAAIIARGYVVDIKESFYKDPDENGITTLTLIRVRLLLTKLSFIGQGTNSLTNLIITQD